MTKYVDMSHSAEQAEKEASPTSSYSLPKYPYGICICLGKDELEKLGLDHQDVEVGDFIHIHALAKITSKSNCETEAGDNPRLELVLAFMEVEDEGEEDEEDEEEEDDEPKGVTGRLYK